MNFINTSNTLDRARDINNLNSSIQTFKDSIGLRDINDFYKFSLSNRSSLNLSIEGKIANTEVEIIKDYNHNGIADKNERIAVSHTHGLQSKSISTVLDSGNYFIKVCSFSKNNSNEYNLNISATPLTAKDFTANTLNNPHQINSETNNNFKDWFNNLDIKSYDTSTSNKAENISLTGSNVINDGKFNSTYGYGLVDAGLAVAKALGLNTRLPNVATTGLNSWSNDMVNAGAAWAKGFTGQGVTVAVIDSGVDINHKDLRDNIWQNSGEIAGNGVDDDGNGYVDDVNGWNFGLNNNNVTDSSSHGTHVAGTIAASNNGFGTTGVAYDSKIMPIRLSNNEDKFSGGLAKAIRYAVDNGARVINMSLSYPDDRIPNSLRDAIAYAANQNVIVVSAAGNQNLSLPRNPARIATEYGFSVGALDSNQVIAKFSNLAGNDSQMHHVMAPGKDILSTLPGNDAYGLKNGTSMATPHVAGVVALMLSANPYLTHAQVRQILTETATAII
jgi:trimeric autotransporter adhesin